jgi:hypothetical protein
MRSNVRFLIAIIKVICVAAASLSMAPLTQARPHKAVDLIDRLVSQNPKPITGDEDKTVDDYRTPEGFDAAKQQLVYKARADLVRLGPIAFPFLIERWDDERYCLTTENALLGPITIIQLARSVAPSYSTSCSRMATGRAG